MTAAITIRSREVALVVATQEASAVGMAEALAAGMAEASVVGTAVAVADIASCSVQVIDTYG